MRRFALVVWAAVVTIVATPAAATAAGWSVVGYPKGTADSPQWLNDVSCTSRLSCEGVGQRDLRGGPILPLALRWNGSRWFTQATAKPSDGSNPTFYGVSCKAAGACTAVGQYHGRGTRYATALVERWDGRRWSVQSSPDPARAGLPGCVGSHKRSWLISVSCPSRNACFAVGSYGVGAAPGVSSSLLERWNGSRSSIVRLRLPAGQPFGDALSSVSCSSPAACTAVGTYYSGASDAADFHSRPLAWRWNGSRWALQPTAERAAVTSGFYAASCAGASSCQALGSVPVSSTVTGPVQPLAESWSPSGWSMRQASAPAGTRQAAATSVS